MERLCRKPNWELFKSLFSEKKTVQAIIDFSIILFKLDQSEIGLYFPCKFLFRIQKLVTLLQVLGYLDKLLDKMLG